MKISNMNIDELTRKKSNEAGKTKKCISKAFVVHDKSVITDNQIIILMGDYDLVTFLPDYEVELRRIRVINVNQEGNILSFTALDLNSKQILHLNRDIFNDITDWIITDLFSSPEDLITDYCDKGR